MAADPSGRSLRALEDERAWRPRAAAVGGVAQAGGSGCSDSPYIYIYMYIISQDGSRPPGSPRLGSFKGLLKVHIYLLSRGGSRPSGLPPAKSLLKQMGFRKLSAADPPSALTSRLGR